MLLLQCYETTRTSNYVSNIQHHLNSLGQRTIVSNI